jgi:hypothetical protein
MRTATLLLVGTLHGLAAGCASFPRAPDEPGGKAWIFVTTPHFSLATDMEDKAAKELAAKLEDWWEAMRIVVADAARRPIRAAGQEEPLLTIALATSSERKALHYRLGGVFSVAPLMPSTVSIGTIDDSSGEQVLKHELAHAFLYDRLPRIPRWLTEGLATYMQTAETDSEARTVRWGMRYQSTEEIIAGSLLGAGAVLDDRNWGPEFSSGWQLQVTAEWLVRMLMNDHPEELACYIERLETDVDLGSAMTECFPSRQGWDIELNRFHASVSFASKTASFAPPSFEPMTNAMSAASVHAVLAHLDKIVLGTVSAEFRTERAQRATHNLNRALELEPANRLAGLLALSEKGMANRNTLTRTLVAEHPDDWRILLRRAEADGVPWDEQKQATERALHIAPEQVEVLRAAAYLSLNERRWADAHRLAARAWLKGASEPAFRALLAITSVEVGLCDDARFWSSGNAAERRLIDKADAYMRAQLELPNAECVPENPVIEPSDDR